MAGRVLRGAAAAAASARLLDVESGDEGPDEGRPAPMSSSSSAAPLSALDALAAASELQGAEVLASLFRAPAPAKAAPARAKAARAKAPALLPPPVVVESASMLQPPAATSKYRGVSWSKASKKWLAYSRHAGKQIHIGRYSDEADAARAVDAAYVERGLPEVNAGVLSGDQKPVDKTPSSIYSGVTWLKSRKKWLAQIRHEGKKVRLGHYGDEKGAARAADNAWAERGLPKRNFILLSQTAAQAKAAKKARSAASDHGAAAAAAAAVLAGPRAPKRKHTGPLKGAAPRPLGPQTLAQSMPPAARPRGATSVFRGVSWMKREAKWRAIIRHDGKDLCIGYFADEADAAAAVDAAYVERGRKPLAPVDKTPSSMYSGVSWEKTKKKWSAKIRHDGKRIYLGRFSAEVDAAYAADAARVERGLPRQNADLLPPAPPPDPTKLAAAAAAAAAALLPDVSLHGRPRKKLKKSSA